MAAAARPGPAWTTPLAEAKWQHHDDWLGNPAEESHWDVRCGKTATTFRVRTPGRGMKWSWGLGKGVALRNWRYVSMRYRATDLRAAGGYAVCVLGRRVGGGPDYEAIISPGDLVADGRWHTVSVDVRPVAARIPEATMLAVQIQAASDKATLEIADLRFVNERPKRRLADAVDYCSGATLAGLRPVALGTAATSSSAAWQERHRLAEWFPSGKVTVDGVAFVIRKDKPDLAATSLSGKGDLRLPLAAPVRATEVYLLMSAALSGEDEPAYGGGRFRAIRDVDRFRVRLEYADGSADECLPMNARIRRFAVIEGPQVLVAAADEARRLNAVVVRDISKQAAFAVAGLTVRTDGKRAFAEALEDAGPLRHAPAPGRGPGPGAKDAPQPSVELRVDGRVVRPDTWQVKSGRKFPFIAPKDDTAARCVYRTRGGIEVTLRLAACERQGRRGVLVHVSKLANTDTKPHRVSLTAPVIGPYRLSRRPEDSWYLMPKRGAAFDNRPCDYAERYCGLFPVQFVDTFSPATGQGVCLRTFDRAALRKRFLLRKQDGAFTIGVAYPQRLLRPGESMTTAEAFCATTDGHWRRGLEGYQRWLKTWHKPVSPRKKWFSEVFNFRQRFLHAHEPMYNPKTGKLDLQGAVAECRREFGGIDYLHLFDWGDVSGVGRTYGRTGDVSPYDMFRGGREALRQAIAGVQGRGVPVGLYIEGYLLQQRGKLGGRFGKQWQLVGPDGKGKFWPGSTEMMICPGVAPWREVQTSTYAAKIRELGVDGMYIDQFGFAGAYKDCFATGHGHGMPSYAVAAERDLTLQIRRAVSAAKRNVAIYTEETPVDVTTQYQDGSFTYAMFSSQRTPTAVPLNVARFAFPTFKTIEILFCDQPTGSWATGVKWVFFNGEAIWLEGPAAQWFEPQTRAAVRKCYAILRKHRDALATDSPVPLVETLAGSVFANAFPAGGKTVYTLYNARHRTFRGPVLRLAPRQGATYYDAWHGRPIRPRRDAGHDVLSLDLGPMDVGCIVVEWSSKR